MSLTPKQDAFVAEYLVDLNATQAAIRAGYSEHTAASIGHELLTKSEIQAAIAEAKAVRASRLEIDADTVLRELLAIATADSNELVEHKLGACRHCHGTGHRYQFTLNELEREEAQVAHANTVWARAGDPVIAFDPMGGIGFNPYAEPHPDCPECHGRGESRPLFKDTGKASPAARALYAGFKVSKEGMEIKLHPKTDALDKIARHLGLYAPQKVDVSTKHSGSVTMNHGATLQAATEAALEAARKATTGA